MLYTYRMPTAEYQRRWRKAHSEAVRESNRKQRKKPGLVEYHRKAWMSYSQRASVKARHILGDVCCWKMSDGSICGWSDPRALQFDHLHGEGTDPKHPNNALEALKHPEKFQLLCANHNWIKRHEQKEHSWRRPTSRAKRVC
jgi:hypothetical protein